MEKNQKKSVVIDVTTKKKYVKPDFEVIELNMEAPLLMQSGKFGIQEGQRHEI